MKRIILKNILLYIGAIFLFFYSINFLNNQHSNIVFFDVGHGDAIFLQLYGKNILIDTGKDNLIITKIADYLDYFQPTIDYLILTHPHMDHVYGTKELLNRVYADEIIISSNNYNNQTSIKLNKWLNNKSVYKVEKEKVLYFSENIWILIINNQLDFRKYGINNTSLVILLNYYGDKFLFMGDCEHPCEARLLANNKLDNICLLKAGHHGAKNTLSNAFLAKIKPEYVIVSAKKAYHNSPAEQKLLKKINLESTKVFFTYAYGDIVFKLDTLNNLCK